MDGLFWKISEPRGPIKDEYEKNIIGEIIGKNGPGNWFSTMIEHSRIYYFENSGNPQVYIGSADWMDRNLSRRVEVVFPIEPVDLKSRIITEILNISLNDNMKARELQSDGSYKKIAPKGSALRIRSQDKFLELAIKNAQNMSAELQSEIASDRKDEKTPVILKARKIKKNNRKKNEIHLHTLVSASFRSCASTGCYQRS